MRQCSLTNQNIFLASAVLTYVKSTIEPEPVFRNVNKFPVLASTKLSSAKSSSRIRPLVLVIRLHQCTAHGFKSPAMVLWFRLPASDISITKHFLEFCYRRAWWIIADLYIASSYFSSDESNFQRLHHFLDGFTSICLYWRLAGYICSSVTILIVSIILADYGHLSSLLRNCL